MKKILLKSILWLSFGAFIFLGLTSLPNNTHAQEVCPTGNDITIPGRFDNARQKEPYQDGHTFGCAEGIRDFDERDESCIGRNARKEDGSRYTNVSKKNSWVNGCFDGYQVGWDLFDGNNGATPEGVKTPEELTRERVNAHCREIGASASAAQGYTTNEESQYFQGCISGFYRQQSGNTNDCRSYIGPRSIGCSGGYLFGQQDQLANSPAVNSPSQATLDQAADINTCGLSFAGESDQNHINGAIQGCVDGYNMQGGANTCPTIDFTVQDPDPRKQSYNLAYANACSVGYNYTIPAAVNAPSYNGSDAPTQFVPDCEPTLPPTHPRGCGIPAFIFLINNVIRWLQIIVFPLGAGFILWGGLLIMTSAGSSEQISKGKKTIKIAIIGILIVLVSVLIVRSVFYLLQVDPQFFPEGIGGNVLK